MSRFDDYNAARAERGRAGIRESTFEAMEEVGVFARDFAFIEGSTAVYAAKLAKAAEVADYWKSIAPVWGDKPPHRQPPSYSHQTKEDPTAGTPNYPGDYRDGIKVLREGGIVRVAATHMPLSLWLEYGSKHNPEHGYGARVLEYFGGGAVENEKKITPGLVVG